MSSPILKLIVQRVALGIVLLFAVSLLIFVGTEILPGDVAQSILGQTATPQALAALREELGLNDPAYVRYLRWLGGVLSGDLGTALTSGHDIASSIGDRLANTLFLAACAAVVAVPLAILLGLLAVRYRNGPVDKAISAFALASTSFPEFFIGYLLVFSRSNGSSSGDLDCVRRHELHRPAARRGAAGDRAHAGGARPHDAHDPRRDPQRHAVGPISRRPS